MGLVGTVFADHCSQLNSPQGKPLCRWSLAHRLMAFSFSRMPVSIWLLAVTLTAGPCTLLAVENFSRVGFAAEFFFFFFFCCSRLAFLSRVTYALRNYGSNHMTATAKHYILWLFSYIMQWFVSAGANRRPPLNQLTHSVRAQQRVRKKKKLWKDVLKLMLICLQNIGRFRSLLNIWR